MATIQPLQVASKKGYDSIAQFDPEHHSEGSSNHQQFSFWVTVAFTINYIVGTGFLTLPCKYFIFFADQINLTVGAFYKTGYTLGTYVMMLLIVPSAIAVFLILETMARANRIFGSDAERNEENDAALCVVGKRKFELTELCQIFLGERARQLYTLSVSLYLYGTLWAYGTVFSNSMTANLPISSDSYFIYLFIFAGVAVPMSCMELSEQISMQVALCLCRLLVMLCMTGSVLYDMYTKNDNFNYTPRDTYDYSEFSGVHILLPIALYATIFHHSIPALTEPVRDKHLVGYMFITGLVICFIGYYLITLTLSMYFGSAAYSSCNLNWENYGNFTTTFGVIVSRVIRWYVLLFPALDVVSLFPLCAITLGNNLYAATHLTSVSPPPTPPTPIAVDSAAVTSTIISFRLLAAIPPICGCFFISNLGSITNFTGITGFIIVFIFPALLTHYSKLKLTRMHINASTVYSNVLTSDPVVFAMLLFGIIVVVYTTSFLIIYGSPR